MFSAEVLIGLRWIHFVAGITLDRTAVLVQPRQCPVPEGPRPLGQGQANPPLLTRALAWFRWSAVVTVAAGLLLIYGLYWQDGNLFGSDTEKTIFVGGLLGIVMLANVWMFIWPNQRRILAAMAAGEAPDPASPRRALYAPGRTSRCRSRCCSSWPAPATTRWTGRASSGGGRPRRAGRDHRADRAEVLGQPLSDAFLKPRPPGRNGGGRQGRAQSGHADHSPTHPSTRFVAAHCDLPCGIYDPDRARIEAESCLRDPREVRRQRRSSFQGPLHPHQGGACRPGDRPPRRPVARLLQANAREVPRSA